MASPAPVSAEPTKDGPKFRAESKAGKASAAFFDEGVVPELRIEIAAEELKKLRANNRAYVRCTVVATVLIHVAFYKGLRVPLPWGVLPVLY